MFYSRPNGELAYLKSQAEQESNAPLYKSANIIVGGNVVVANTKSPQIAAVSYSLKGHDQVRAIPPSPALPVILLTWLERSGSIISPTRAIYRNCARPMEGIGTSAL